MFSVGAVPSDTTATLTSATPTPMIPSGRSSNNIPAIVAAVLAITVLAAVSAVVMILIMLRRKRKTKEATVTAVHYTARDESEGLNPLYSGECMHIASSPKKHC